MLELVERRKLSDVVVGRIKEYIAANDLKPGDRLPTEHELAERFGVSRVSLREATKALGFLGILEAKPGRGLTVGRVDGETFRACLSVHPALLGVPLEQLIDTRLIIELGVVPHVARRMAEDPSIYERLDAINQELMHTKELMKFIELDVAFHSQLVAASGLSPMAAFNDLFQVFFHRFRESVNRAGWKGGIAQHTRIIDALRKGNTRVATEELREHIESHLARLDVVKNSK
jgi:GntR family transcriptional regulator, transcriptional repressor for pyruvate dehydrogenase complex